MIFLLPEFSMKFQVMCFGNWIYTAKRGMLFKCAGLAQKNMLPNPLLSVSNKQILTQSFDTSSNIDYDNIIIANSALLPSVKRGSRVETL